MRIGTATRGKLKADDVAWVAEWQLAESCPWVPIGDEPVVAADDAPSPDGRWWVVTVTVGSWRTAVRLPARDMARVVAWCYRIATVEALRRPPAAVRGSMSALRKALQSAVVALDPLARMGYRAGFPSENSG